MDKLNKEEKKQLEEKIKEYVEKGGGVDVEKEQQGNPKDWLAGEQNIAGFFSSLKYYDIGINGKHRKYSSPGETQKYDSFDDFGCTHHTTIDNAQNQINRMLQVGYTDPITKIEYSLDRSKLEKWIDETGHFNGSNRFNIYTGGNVPGKGNSMTAGPEALRTKGVCAEKTWPALSNYSEKEFYKKPSQSAYDEAKELLNYFEFPYEKLTPKSLPQGKTGIALINTNDLIYHLYQAPVNIAVGICPGWWNDNGNVQSCNASPVHSILLEEIDDIGTIVQKMKRALDHYIPYDKQLSWFYPIYFATKQVVIPKPSILIPKIKIDMTKVKILKDPSSPAVGVWVPAKDPQDLINIAKFYNRIITDPVKWQEEIDGDAIVRR